MIKTSMRLVNDGESEKRNNSLGTPEQHEFRLARNCKQKQKERYRRVLETADDPDNHNQDHIPYVKNF
ncbi:4563_t:CDS:2 [Rhizophagus irregularis]|nr:4563_t:CDS:2 [Rhizophagus irregularis]